VGGYAFESARGTKILLCKEFDHDHMIQRDGQSNEGEGKHVEDDPIGIAKGCDPEDNRKGEEDHSLVPAQCAGFSMGHFAKKKAPNNADTDEEPREKEAIVFHAV
jgi:hypothetical protein